MKIPELLAPAGNFEKLETALHYGADAVYMGISGLSLRAKADNFTFKELQQAAGLVRSQGKKLYITVNIFPHNRDISIIKFLVVTLIRSVVIMKIHKSGTDYCSGGIN